MLRYYCGILVTCKKCGLELPSTAALGGHSKGCNRRQKQTSIKVNTPVKAEVKQEVNTPIKQEANTPVHIPTVIMPPAKNTSITKQSQAQEPASSEEIEMPQPQAIASVDMDKVREMVAQQTEDASFKIVPQKKQVQQIPKQPQEQTVIMYVDQYGNPVDPRQVAPPSTVDPGITQIVREVGGILRDYMQLRIRERSGGSMWDSIGPKLFENYYMNFTKERGKAKGKKLDNDVDQEDGDYDMFKTVVLAQYNELKELKAKMNSENKIKDMEKQPQTIEEQPHIEKAAQEEPQHEKAQAQEEPQEQEQEHREEA